MAVSCDDGYNGYGRGYGGDTAGSGWNGPTVWRGTGGMARRSGSRSVHPLVSEVYQAHIGIATAIGRRYERRTTNGSEVERKMMWKG